ncbi:MAG: ferrous iron transport protein B [Desulfurococcales archaeon]|nr:ferrous iron transport protein B [Desulfurococcales archaeon]
MMRHHVQKQVKEQLGENCDKTIALLGAPNTGKSTLFTVLTKKTVTIANWPGVTVDIEVGKVRVEEKTLCIIDLPGTYGLIPTSPEETIARQILIQERPDLIAVVLDLSQPEASLGLVVQAIEAFPGKIIVVGTKANLAHAMGYHVDTEALGHILKVKVVKTSALENIGIESLREELLQEKGGGRVRIDYGILEATISRLEEDPEIVAAAEKLGYSPRWIAVQSLYGDISLLNELARLGYTSLVERLEETKTDLEKRLGISLDIVITEHRISYIEKVAKQVIVRRKPASTRWQQIADLFMHPVIGVFLSFLGLLATFTIVFAVNTGFPLNIIFGKLGFEHAATIIEEYSISSLLDGFFSWLANTISQTIGGPLGSLIGDGIIGGVGFVVSFLPLIAMIYFSIAILEDSGLAARMAVSFHPLFKKFGLSGRSVFPLVMGLGCNVPAVLATKALNEEERFRAAFAVPFIPCQARIVVIAAFTITLVQGVLHQTLAISIVFVEAFVAAIVTSLIASRIVQPRLYKDLIPDYQPEPEILMEIPPVHSPHWKVIWWTVRDNTLHFLRKAGTVIFLLAIATWAMLNLGPSGYVTSIDDSFGAIIGNYAGMVTHLIGVEKGTDRILGIALVDGLIAKEGVLTAIAVSLGGESQSIHSAIQGLGLTTAQSIAYLVMISLYFPCIATLAAMIGIVKSKKLVAAYAVYSILLAILFSALTYKLLLLVGIR